MKKTTTKKYRKYQDFYTNADLRDPDVLPHLNLTIGDFDARGCIVNPRAPCVVTTIEPAYIEDAKEQRIPKKFRVKTDILRLREITRKKFYVYATQQRHLEKQREAAEQEHIYQRSVEFHEFAEDCLKKMEAQAFSEMVAANEELKQLRDNKVAEQLETVAEEHQRALMQVQDSYHRFQFLLKLIGYFDDIAEEEQPAPGEPLVALVALSKPKELTELNISERTTIGATLIEQLKAYMDKTVRPYLDKRRHLDADVWIKGYELTRQKIFHYNRRLTHMAMLNHIVSIVHDKFERSYARRTATPIFLKDPKFMQERVESLQTRAKGILVEYELLHKKDKLNLTLTGVVPVILRTIELTLGKRSVNGHQAKQAQERHVVKAHTGKQQSKPETAGKREQETTLAQVEKIQAHLLGLLNELDALPPEMVKSVERRVRRRMHADKEMSRRALVKQTRLHNWMEHFKRHELAKRDY